jgi:hypothetical protein
MRRWLFNILCLLSLLLCIGMLVVWVRSYFRFDHWETIIDLYTFAPEPPNLRSLPPSRRITTRIILGRQLKSSLGCFGVSWDRMHLDLTQGNASVPADRPATIQKWRTWSTPKVRPLSPRLDKFAGVGYYSSNLTDRSDPTHVRTLQYRIVQIPYWLPTVLLSALPLCWLRIGRRRATATGFCRVCGYDLRASPDRCPECGRAALRLQISEIESEGVR